ncbi:MAG: hypothetical protein ABIA63_12835, partial [bacterium]
MQKHNILLKGSTVLEFGYGGTFGTALEFLNLGAEHVFLLDKYAQIDDKKNVELFKNQYADKFLKKQGQTIIADPRYIT